MTARSLKLNFTDRSYGPLKIAIFHYFKNEEILTCMDWTISRQLIKKISKNQKFSIRSEIISKYLSMKESNKYGQHYALKQQLNQFETSCRRKAKIILY